MKNKMTDLNNHLFEQLERLNDDDLKGEALETEIKRSQAMTSVTKEIIANARIGLDAAKLRAEYGGMQKAAIPEMLESDNG